MISHSISDTSSDPTRDQKLGELPLEFLQIAIEAAPDPIFIKDQEHRWVYCNKAFCNFLGHSQADLMGKSDFDLLPREQAEVFWEKDELVLSTGIPNENEEVITLAPQEIRIISTQKSRFQDQTGTYFIIGIIRDITQRKQTEVALQELNHNLEAVVAERTNELQDVIVRLESEIKERQQAEEKIREHFNLLNTVIGGTSEGIFVKNKQGEYLLVNSACCEILERSKEGILGKNDYHIFSAEIAKTIQSIDQEIIATGHSKCFEQTLEIGTKTRTFLMSKNPYYNAQGEIIGLIGIARDISDRKQIEEDLKHSKQLFQHVMDNIPQLIFWKDLNLVYQGCNLKFAQGMGMKSPSEIIGKTDADLIKIHQKNWQQQQNHNFDLEKYEFLGNNQKCQQVIFSQEPEYHLIQSQRKLNNQETWLDSCIIPLYDSEENVIGVLGTHEDITERKTAEIQLIDQQQTFRTILDHAPIWIWMTGIDGPMKFINTTFCSQVGIPESQFLSAAHYSNILPPEVSVNCMASDAACFAQDTPHFSEELLPFVDGKKHHVEIIKTKVRNHCGEVVGLIGLAVDATERKQFEAILQDKNQRLEQTLSELQQTQTQLVQSEKMSSLGQLVAGVAHEINNPVNFIHGNLIHASQYIQDILELLDLYAEHYPYPHLQIQEKTEEIDLAFLSEDLPKVLTSMRVGADRIRAIIQSLRTFSRLDEAEVKNVDLHEGIESTLMILQNRLKSRSDHPAIQVIKNYGNLPKIECYAGQLNQVFMNILTNAIDALEDKLSQGHLFTPCITLTTQTLDTQQVVIHICDNALGMSLDVQKRLFDPFFTTKAVGKGTGLGMSISYEIVTNKHQGSLQCNSTVGEGTEFIITIPVQTLQIEGIKVS